MNTTRAVGRPRGFDESKVLGQIMDLFWMQGFHGTSLAAIEQTTGLKKQSLYAAFGDKHSMYLKALANYEHIVIDAAGTALRGSGPPLKRISDFLSAPINAAFDKGDTRGCFLCNASADRAALDPETEQLVERGFMKLEAALARALADETPHERQADHSEQARLFLAVYSGLRVMAQSGMARNHLESARDLALASSTPALTGFSPER
jgi:AcrR family transcriptional regulator